MSLPLVIRWTVRDFDGRFGVFIDETPMAPGKDLRSLGRRDKACRRIPGCPDERWFASRHIYRTDTTSLTLDELPDTRPPGRTDLKERHQAVIVLLDRNDRRLGEAAFFVDFFVDRKRDG